MKKMKFNLVALSFLLLSCGSVNNEQADAIANQLDSALAGNSAIEEENSIPEEGDLFTSKDGKFKINFSGTPTESSDIVPTEVGNIEMTSFMYEKSATEAYMVAYNDYPSEMVKNSSVDDLLDGAKNGSSSSLGITQFDIDKKMEIEGNPGRHFKGTNGAYYAEYKLFLKGNRLYQIALIRDGSYATPERAEAFFGSFALTE